MKETNLMESEDKGTHSEEKTIEDQQKERFSIFSKEEVRSIVKGFVSAWLRQGVSIEFPTAEEILARDRWQGKQITATEATQRELTGKKELLELIMICCGDRSATDVQVEEATLKLFGAILRLRAGERIKGSFWEYNLEDRLSILERGLELTNNLVKELVELHKKELTD
jgi:hypothetical protein